MELTIYIGKDSYELLITDFDPLEYQFIGDKPAIEKHYLDAIIWQKIERDKQEEAYYDERD